MEPGDEELLRAIVRAALDAELEEILEGVESGPAPPCPRLLLDWEEARTLSFLDYCRPN